MDKHLCYTYTLSLLFFTSLFSSQKPSEQEYLSVYNKLIFIKKEAKKKIESNQTPKPIPSSALRTEDQKILGLADFSALEDAAAFALTTFTATAADQHNKPAPPQPAKKYTAQQLEEKQRKKKIKELTLKLINAASKSLLSTDPDNSKKIYLHYPLHEATRLGFADCVSNLIEMGAPVDSYNHVGKIPLHLVCGISNEQTAVAIARALLSAGCNPNQPTRLGDTALYYAALYQKWTLTKVLIDSGAYDNPGPLLSVIPYLRTIPDRDLAQALIEQLEYNSNKPKNPQHYIHTRSLQSDNDLYRVLLKKDYKRAQFYLERGTGDNVGPGGSVLPMIVYMEDEVLAKSFLISLIAHNADPNFLIHGNNLLYHALVQKKYSLAKALLTMGAVDNTGPAKSVEQAILDSNDIDLIALFKIRKDLPAPQFYERTQDLSPRQ